MSTSRSSILGLLVVTLLIILNSINYQDQKRKLAKIGTFLSDLLLSPCCYLRLLVNT